MLISNICKNYKNRKILNNVSLSIGCGQKIALIGSNGVGKSTLLKILAGIEEPDSGTIEMGGDRVGYLPQEIKIESTKSIEGYLKDVTNIGGIETKMTELENDLTKNNNIKEYNRLRDEYTYLDGYTFESRMRSVLKGFGLDAISTSRQINTLSGGQKSKVALAGLLLSKFDLLLLDEPTNNLDLPAIIWLEEFLKKISVSCLIISHDRHFLDKLVTKVFEIDWFKRDINEYTGSYSSYLNNRAKEINRSQEQYRIQQKVKDRFTKSIQKKKQWAQKGSVQTPSDNDKYSRGFSRDRSSKQSKDAKSIEKKIEQIDEVDIIKSRPKLIISLDVDKNKTKHSIIIKGAKVEYSSGFKLGPVNMQIEYGSRVGIIGLNGSGKSTLLKVIGGELNPNLGDVNIGASLRIGNLMQAHENMARDKLVYEFLSENSTVDRKKIYLMLNKFHFDVGDTKKKIGDLSPGERSRVLLALFSLLSVNVLLLDEPTNHLDFEVLDALEQSLVDYSGIVVFVSHDRYFIEMINPTELFAMNNGIMESFNSYNDYLNYLSNLQSFKE